MILEELNEILTGEKKPKFLLIREKEIISKCLELINSRIDITKEDLKFSLFAAYLTGQDNAREGSRGRPFSEWYPDNIKKELQIPLKNLHKSKE